MKLHNLESEKAVLGAMIIDRKAYFTIAHILTRPDHFFFAENREIYIACTKLSLQDGKPIDLVLLGNELKGKKIDLTYLIELAQSVNNSKNIQYHAHLLVECWIKRNCVDGANKIIEMAKNESTDCFEMVEVMSASANTSLESTSHGVVKSLAQLREEFAELFKLTIHSGGVIGIGANLKDLDMMLGGFQKSKYYLIAARPAMGKTAFGLYLIYRFAVLKIRCLVFSLEMPAREVYARLVCIELGLTGQQINRGIREVNDEGLVMMTDDDINYYLSLVEKSPVLNSEWVHIDDTSALDINDQRAKVNVHKNQFTDLQVVMSDYIGLKKDRTSKGNRENEMSSISMKCKQMAKETDTIWIELAQLNRGVEQRGGDKRPQLSDLRESGSLEQDADVVMLLYRPEYYKIEQDENGNDVKNTTEVIVAKHRGGSVGSVWLRSFMSSYRYYDIDYVNIPTLDIDHQIVQPKEIQSISDVLKANNITGASNFEHPF